MCGPTTSSAGVTIAIGWASCQTATTLTGGFRATEKRGTVTRVEASDHGRTIVEIDGRSVKSVYEEWSGGRISEGVTFDEEGKAMVLSSSSFCPLGEKCANGYIRVMHPAILHESGSLTTFGEARGGMNICMLDAAPETLAKKISQNARALLEESGVRVRSTEHCVSLADAPSTRAAGAEAGSCFGKEDLVGALSIFCGGLVMAIDLYSMYTLTCMYFFKI